MQPSAAAPRPGDALHPLRMDVLGLCPAPCAATWHQSQQHSTPGCGRRRRRASRPRGVLTLPLLHGSAAAAGPGGDLQLLLKFLKDKANPQADPKGPAKRK